MPAPRLTEVTTVACLFFIFLIPLAAAGLALMNVGLGRSRSAGHMMMASLCALAVAGLAYFVCGFAWQGFIGSPAHLLAVSGKNWNWIAAEPFFFRKLSFDGSAASLAALFQIFCVGLAALIPLGSGADRWRLRASCLSTALLAAWTYPLFAHWVWGGGWLAQLGVNYGIGRGFLDAGGSGSIQVVGRPHGSCRHLDPWSASREIFRGRHGTRNPRPQCGSGSFWLRAGPGRLDWTQFRGRHPLYGRRIFGGRVDRDQYDAGRVGLGAHRGVCHQSSVRQTRCFAHRQRLDRRTGRQQRVLRVCESRGGGRHWLRRRRRDHLFGRIVRVAHGSG